MKMLYLVYPYILYARNRKRAENRSKSNARSDELMNMWKMLLRIYKKKAQKSFLGELENLYVFSCFAI
jgi:hypothetical protein